MKTILSIAGSDCSGGAGIQADIKTITAHKQYAMSVITALTAQNTTGVWGIMRVNPQFVKQQLECVFSDIPPDAVKIGMVLNTENIRVIADKLKEYRAKNVVVDPVMISSSGRRLLEDEAIMALRTLLMPLADLITPNIPEAEVLSGISVNNEKDMGMAAEIIAKAGNNHVLIKGGHLQSTADDLLYSEGELHWYRSQRVDNNNSHGTGCTLSSAIACNLAAGFSLEQSIQKAKVYINQALGSGLNLGQGRGPLNHCC